MTHNYFPMPNYRIGTWQAELRKEDGELRRAKFIERLRLLAHQEEIHGKPVLTLERVEELIGLAN